MHTELQHRAGALEIESVRRNEKSVHESPAATHPNSLGVPGNCCEGITASGSLFFCSKLSLTFISEPITLFLHFQTLRRLQLHDVVDMECG